MTAPNPELVHQIAQQVLRTLAGEQGAATRVAPPLGQCAGAADGPDDGGASANHAAAETPRAVTLSRQAEPPRVEALTETPVMQGLVTAHELDDAVASSPDGNVVLAASARLSPLAQDRVRREPQRFRREAVSAEATGLSPVNHGQPWLWWTCGRCPAVQRVVETRRSRLLPIAAPREPAALPTVLRDLNAAVATGRAAGGVLFVSGAAKPMCLANRLRGLRAILGHCDDAVLQGVRDLGANVLVLEFLYLDYDEMSGRVDRMLASSPGVPATIAPALVSVEGPLR